MTKVPAQRFGMHAAPDVNEQATLDIVRKSHARSHTALNSAGLALKIYDAAASVINEEPIIIARLSYPDQDWASGDEANPDKYVRDLGGYTGGKTYLMYLNEGVIGGSLDQLQAQLRQCIKFMDACIKYNVRGAVGGFADASILETKWLDTGVYDDFLRKAVTFTRGGHGVIVHHQYMYGALPWGGGGKDPMDMADPRLMAPQAWPSRGQMTSSGRQNWYIFRNQPWLERAVKLTGQDYLWIVGEGTHDDMPNLRENGVSGKIEAAAGLPKLRGLLDQKRLFTRWWPGWDEATGYIEQLRWLDGILPASCLGVNIFALNGDPQWASYNLLNWPGLWPTFYSFADKLSQGASPVTPIAWPKPASAGAMNVRTITADYQIRSGPGTNYTRVAGATKGATVYVSTGGSQVVDGLTWRWVEVGTIGGWMADQGQWMTPSATFGPLQCNLIYDLEQQTGAINDCGPAMSCDMIQQRENAIDVHTHDDLTHFDVRKAMHVAAGTLTSDSQNVDVMNAYGTPAYVSPLGLDTVIAELIAGRIVGIRYERGAFPGAQVYYDFKGEHYSTINGWGFMSDGKKFLSVKDPLGKDNGPGDGLFVSESSFWNGVHSLIFIKPDGYVKTTEPAPTPDPVPEPPADPSRTWTRAEIVEVVKAGK